ncbi:MAG: hypothetical protein RID42_00220 [Alphaproteobacteria bacterium]
MALPSFEGFGFSDSATDFGVDFGFGQPSLASLGYHGGAADFGLDSSASPGAQFSNTDIDASPDPGFNEIGETPPPLRVVPLPPEERPPRVNQPVLAPLPVVPLPPEERMPAPVVDTAVADRAAQDAQAEGDAANDRRRRAAVIRDRQNPTGPRGLLTRPLVQRPRLLGQ